MATIADYYKYAQLASAAYVRLGPFVGSSNPSVSAVDLVREGTRQDRLPLSIGQYLFDPSNTYGNQNTWAIRSYYGGDMPTVAGPDGVIRPDISGFAATLFQQGENGEKVLAIRGTEPFADGGVDLLSADVGQIGVFGLALTQLVSLVNLIQRLKAPADTLVRQISVHAQFTAPDIGIPVIATGVLRQPVYLVFDTYNGRGEGKILDGQTLTLTGHSLGGELAVLGALLFPDEADHAREGSHNATAAPGAARGGAVRLRRRARRTFGCASVHVPRHFDRPVPAGPSGSRDALLPTHRRVQCAYQANG